VHLITAVFNLLMWIFIAASPGYPQTTSKKGPEQVTSSHKEKKKLSGRQVAKIRKKAEQDLKRHRFDEGYLEYTEMVKASERGMKQASAALRKGR
jgi:hypothetical protein